MKAAGERKNSIWIFLRMSPDCHQQHWLERSRSGSRKTCLGSTAVMDLKGDTGRDGGGGSEDGDRLAEVRQSLKVDQTGTAF